MSSLRPVIRLVKFRLDDIRRVLVALRQEEDELRLAISALEEEVVREREVARESSLARMSFGHYMARCRHRRSQLDGGLADVGARIAIQMETLGDLFHELKRYELVEEARVAAAALEEARRQRAQQDETGAVTFIRRQRQALRSHVAPS